MRSWFLISLSPFLLICFVFFLLSRPIVNLVDKYFSIECHEGNGKSILFDIADRESEKAQKFLSDVEIAALRASVREELGRSVVIWVHGFQTGAEEADCAARALDIALSEQGLTSDVIVFAWPSQFELNNFSIAESMAEAAGAHLAVLLNNLKDQNVAIVTHSLGARVALEAIRKVESEELGQLNLLYMIQPAVPATSVRRATLDFTCIPAESGKTRSYINFPTIDGYPSCIENASKMRQEFTGCYAEAILKVAAVRATFGDGDPVLGGPFALQHGPTDTCFGPTLPAVIGTASTKLPQYLALGSRWRERHGACVFHEFQIVGDKTQSSTFSDSGVERHTKPTVTDEAEQQMGPCVEYVESAFRIEHPDFQLVELRRLRHFWRIVNRHSPQHLPEAQKAIAKALNEHLADQP